MKLFSFSYSRSKGVPVILFIKILHLLSCVDHDIEEMNQQSEHLLRMDTVTLNVLIEMIRSTTTFRQRFEAEFAGIRCIFQSRFKHYISKK